jgi:transcription-repair coupling factor (superfamily II helicase)
LTQAIQERAGEIKDKYPAALEILQKISQGMIVDGMESLIPLLTDGFETIFDRLPKDTHVVFLDEERIRSRTSDLIETNAEFLAASWSNAAIGGSAPLPVEQVTYLDWQQLREEIQEHALQESSFNSFGTDLDSDSTFLDFSPIDPMRGNVEALCELMRTGLEAHHSIIFSTTVTEWQRDMQGFFAMQTFRCRWCNHSLQFLQKALFTLHNLLWALGLEVTIRNFSL